MGMMLKSTDWEILNSLARYLGTKRMRKIHRSSIAGLEIIIIIIIITASVKAS
jgi:hypothetical protein